MSEEPHSKLRNASDQPPVRLSRRTAEELYAASGAAGWNVSLDAFSARLEASAARKFQGESPAPREVDAYVRALHVADLALACACTAGHEAAWEHFVRELRPPMYAASRAMTGDWRELADSLWAELYGLDERGGARRSLLDYYHGRARLSTWLRTVLAQRHVDAVRAGARTVPLEAHTDTREDPLPVEEPGRGERMAAVQRALDAAIEALDARDRLRLRLYYGEGVKLARIGQLLGEHEATVSRKLDRTRRDLRTQIERTLRDEHGLAADAIGDWMKEAAGAAEIDMSRALDADST